MHMYTFMRIYVCIYAYTFKCVCVYMYVHGFKHQFSVVRLSNGATLFASVCNKKGKMCVCVHTSVCVRVYM